MSATQLYRRLKPQYQAQADEVQAKPYKLVRWKFIMEDGENTGEHEEEEVARGKSAKGLRAWARMKGTDPEWSYVIYREWIEEWIDGWYPSYEEEIVEELDHPHEAKDSAGGRGTEPRRRAGTNSKLILKT